ncbi:diaminopropionate ammonia-lyase [Limosilactobacillus reuteri]|uniref:diaminopropionate ammonia-lyase n=1 Tax=Limosilactobacillus reuteri TaxID=1598 RepID=UPI001E4390DF|nr:diaminopropionate ammonia-lyase [Limosilactobacillus reuteri]MCC4435471.1 diaminopropionate ammonia-lyase [Limosilactobacillus reuteri]MCC4437653.1 diaminopropionate ammonia-lyase [Limosilactobacillus reuteri]MCC4442143.1 diaminopropionate ammonia-lyase [Limosilactobacillus reuteri]MCC4444083.1 diaminopropionate ammonia-lyase [Limosilactobacillus reuteri]MCC4446335.1 diaminopropionate ammonia-lyase [Limosilactobacillus reuteri]
MTNIQLIKSPFSLLDKEFPNDPLINIATNFYQSVPFYRPTPLVELKHFAHKNNLGKVYIKDEAQRFDSRLKAFKATGGFFAMACCIAKRAGLPLNKLTYQQLQSPTVKNIANTLTFYTATDGNHGRGIAWAAAKLGTHSVIKMPAGSTKLRAKHIAQFNNSQVEITDKNYDDTVQYANKLAQNDPHGILIQDMAWQDYTEIPQEISAGYSIIVTEILDQLTKNNYPTHLFLQAGVGQLSSGIINALFSSLPINYRPTVIIVEPSTVACYFLSAQKADGKAHTVSGSPKTIMAGLNCQTPSSISFPIIKETASFYGTLTDDVAIAGMRTLAYPDGSDPVIVSGESGVASFAFLNAAVHNLKYRQLLNLDSSSRILIINTEGDTDEHDYQEIIK